MQGQDGLDGAVIRLVHLRQDKTLFQWGFGPFGTDFSG